MATTSKVHNELTADLTKRIEDFLDTGVFIQPFIDAYDRFTPYMLNETQLKYYVKRLARYEKRRCLIAEDASEWDWSNRRKKLIRRGNKLTLRKIQRNAPLLSALIIAAHKLPSRYDIRKDTQHSVFWHEGSGVSTFWFMGEPGLAILENYLQAAKTNPNMRKALGLPPLEQ